jgi:hypothetical protein
MSLVGELNEIVKCNFALELDNDRMSNWIYSEGSGINAETS